MKKIPLSRCRKCARFHGYYCPLQDLDPCDFIPLKREENKLVLYLKIVAIPFILFILLLLFAGCKKKPEPQFIPKWSVVEMLRKQRGTLSEWDQLILAIAFTESRMNPDAKGKNGDSGCLQIVPVYVDEVNRIYGTEYTIEDAFDIGKSLEMYELMQGYYNEGKSIDRAIYLHNKSPQYRETVLKNLEIIRNYEEIRRKITEK